MRYGITLTTGFKQSAGSGASTLLGAETQGLAIDFTDATFLGAGHYGSAKIIDTGTPANDYDSHPYGKLSYTSASAKMCLGPSGTLRFGAHNLQTRSEEFDTSPWSTTNATITANAAVAPDGTTTADVLTEDNTTNQHQVAALSASVVQGATYIFSIWAKRVTGTRNARLLSISPDVIVQDAILTTEWQQITKTFTTTTSGSFDFRIRIANDAAGTTNYLGDGTSSIAIWGAQLTRTPCDTTYLSTTSSARYALPYEWNTSGVLQGILVEESRTNSVGQSQNFSTVYWNTASLNATPTENTTQTALLGIPVFTITPRTVSGIQRFYRSTGELTATSATMSAIVKPNGYTQVGLRESVTTGAGCVFDLTGSGSARTPYSAGTLTASNPQITALPNGFYRISVTLSGSSTSMGFGLYVLSGYTSGDIEAATFTGNGTSGVFATAFQLEAGAFVTSYIPTVSGSTVTRAADDISLVTTAFPFSLANGTVYLEATRRASTGNRWLLGFATSTGLFDVVGGDTNLNFRHGATSNIDLTNAAQFTSGKIAGGYTDGGTHSLSVNGGAASSTASNSATIVGSSLLRIGVDGPGTSANYFNSHIAKIMYLPRRMSGSELQTLST